MLPTINLGPVALPTPALIIIVSLWLFIYVSERHAHRIGIHPSHLANLVLLVLVSGIIGARLAYVARYLDYFLYKPEDIISLSPDLLDPGAGLFLGILIG